jgi:MFS transporter, ACS family, glucarate transporter
VIATRHLLVPATFLLAVLLYVDRVCISTAKGPITADLKLTEIEFGWVLSSFALGYALGQVPAGMLADRFGPRLILAAIVTIWSFFTGLTGLVTSLATLLVVRFCFGVGEAGAYPSIARAVYAWFPITERGIVQGINHSGGRLGAAFALPAIAALIEAIGWRSSFIVLMLVGFVWAAGWFVWFRDEPSEGLPQSGAPGATQPPTALARRKTRLSVTSLFTSTNLWLLMLQYFSGNFTFFFCLTWLFPHLQKTYELDSLSAGLYSAAPLICGALGHLTAGYLVDRIYRAGRWKLSRRLVAIIGFVLAAAGLVASTREGTVQYAVVCLSIAIFGADMTISPSWAVCVDIGRQNSGAVSGTMNMAGNLGSFVTSLAFPYLLAWTGDVRLFLFTAAGLNLLAVGAWLFVRPDLPLGAEGVEPA